MNRKNNLLSNTGIQRAVDYIQDGIHMNRWKEGERLPVTRLLARMIHVNNHTLSLALKNLAQTKTVTAIARGGIYVGCPTEKKTPKTAPSSGSWKNVRLRFEHDLFNGTFSSGALPPAKVLAQRYGVCYQTMRKACEALRSDGVLSFEKNRFCLESHFPASQSTCVLSISAGKTELISLYDDFLRLGVSALDLACSRNRLILAKTGTDSNNSGAALRKKGVFEGYFGYLIWTTGIDKTLLDEILTQLVTLDKPVAIIDELSAVVLPQALKASTRLKIFTPAGRIAGKTIGRYLIGKGHRTCAYISVNHATPWSENRLYGLQECFDNSGFTNGVIPIVQTLATRADIEAATTGQQLSFAQKTLLEFERLFPTGRFWSYAKLESALTAIETDEYIAYHVLWKGLFTQALNNPAITAWVCANDQMAFMAITFLNEPENSEMKDRIAIIGFDDEAKATEYNITSYNFAPASIAEKALGYIIYPRQEIYRGETRIECEGLLIERGSTSLKKQMPIKPKT